ncbi:MAG: N-acetyltransferase [Planctomycetaceae bacterium]|nr:N-acetyltransferase [Planctomycetaceae bacterium]
MHVRDAVEADLPAVLEIYNQSIPGGWSTADTAPVTVAERVEWFRKFDPKRRPLWVAEVDGRIVGWIGLTSFYGGRPAYDATAEVSTYIAKDFQKKGLGGKLKRLMIAQCPRLGVTTMLSMYFDHNPATHRLNTALGFEKVGHLTEIATINGRKYGLIIAALRIPPSE